MGDDAERTMIERTVMRLQPVAPDENPSEERR